MAALLSIGEFSRMTHLSVQALRQYHELGVLEPAAIDQFSGYRSYDTSQVRPAQAIRRLRDLGMPLDSIRRVLTAPDGPARSRAIAAHLARLEQQPAQTKAAVPALRGLLDGPAPRPAIELRAIPAVTALAVSEVVSAADLEQWGTSAFEALAAALSASGLSAAGPFGALYPGDFFELERSEITVFLPVGSVGSSGSVGPVGSSGSVASGGSGGSARSGGAAGRPAHGGVRLLEIPAVEAAVAVHEGGSADIDRTYGALGTAVAERAIGTDGPIREYYLVSSLDAADESQHRTEICWPVFLTAA